MLTLTDYLDLKVLRQVQYSFAQVTASQVTTYGSKGELLVDPTEAIEPGGSSVEADITFAGHTLGRAVMRLGPEADAAAGSMLGFYCETLRQLCKSKRKLRERVDELATVYKLTALFTGHRDLQNVLDIVVDTVGRAVDVKACGLRLLDAHTGELTIKAVANLSEEYLDKGAILLSDSILDTEAFETGDVVYIADERTDPRVMFPAETRREGIVSALIVPLLYKGRRVGVLRLYTAQKYRFSRHEVAMVKAIAAQAAAAIVNTQLREETRHAEDMRRQLLLAGQVQRRMIPMAPPEMPGLDLSAIYVPSLELSGDFYDFLVLPENNLGLAICDVMGKGVPAGLLTASIRASLRAHADEVYELADILGRVNRSVCEDTLTSSFATLFYGVINTATMEFTYANAGHEPPMLIRDGSCLTLAEGGTVLGVRPDLEYDHSVVQLQRGDVLMLTTDGIIEAMNFKEEQFGRQRTLDAAMAAVARGEDAEGVAKHVLWEMRRFAGLRDRGDDVTMVTVRVL